MKSMQSSVRSLSPEFNAPEQPRIINPSLLEQPQHPSLKILSLSNSSSAKKFNSLKPKRNNSSISSSTSNTPFKNTTNTRMINHSKKPSTSLSTYKRNTNHNSSCSSSFSFKFRSNSHQSLKKANRSQKYEVTNQNSISNAIKQNSIETSYFQANNNTGFVSELQSKLDGKNQLIKSQRYQIDHLQRKLKRYQSQKRYEDNSGVKVRKVKNVDQDKLGKKEMECDQLRIQNQKLSNIIEEYKYKLRESNQEKRNFRQLISQQQKAFSQKLSDLNTSVSSHNQQLLKQNAKLRDLLSGKDLQIDRVILQIDKLKEELTDKQKKLQEKRTYRQHEISGITTSVLQMSKDFINAEVNTSTQVVDNKQSKYTQSIQHHPIKIYKDADTNTQNVNNEILPSFSHERQNQIRTAFQNFTNICPKQKQNFLHHTQNCSSLSPISKVSENQIYRDENLKEIFNQTSESPCYDRSNFHFNNKGANGVESTIKNQKEISVLQQQNMELKQNVKNLQNMRSFCNDISILELEKRFALKEKKLHSHLSLMKRRYAEVKKELNKAESVNNNQEQILKEMTKMAREGTQAMLNQQLANRQNQDFEALKNQIESKKREILDLKSQIHIQLQREEELKDQLCNFIEKKAAEKMQKHNQIENLNNAINSAISKVYSSATVTTNQVSFDQEDELKNVQSTVSPTSSGHVSFGSKKQFSQINSKRIGINYSNNPYQKHLDSFAWNTGNSGVNQNSHESSSSLLHIQSNSTQLYSPGMLARSSNKYTSNQSESRYPTNMRVDTCTSTDPREQSSYIVELSPIRTLNFDEQLVPSKIYSDNKVKKQDERGKMNSNSLWQKRRNENKNQVMAMGLLNRASSQTGNHKRYAKKTPPKYPTTQKNVNMQK